MCTKVVNIYPTTPIIGVNPPIRSSVKKVTKTIEDIRTCLMARAIVDEVLSDGTTIRLTNSNYDKMNDIKACGCSKTEEHEHTVEDSVPEAPKSDWDIAYQKALEGVDLSRMTNKQKKAAKAAARAEADKTVAEAGNAETNEQPAEVVTDSTVEDTEEETVETTDIEADAVKAE